MMYDQNNQLPTQRKRHDWISFLFPLTFLLIFVFTQYHAGILTEDEFTHQKKQILQGDVVRDVRGATEPKEASAQESENQHEEMLVSYPQE